MLRKLCVLILIFFSLLTAQEAPQGKKFKIIKQVSATPVKDQGRSSTCWSFATVSFIESELLRMGKGEWNLSEIFIARNVYRDKAIMHVRMIGNNFFTPGGQAHQVMNAVEKYGIVPEISYSELTGGSTNHNHDALDEDARKFIAAYTKEDILPNLRKRVPILPQNWIAGFDDILDKHLGKLPETIEYKGQKYTPRSFTANVLGFTPSDYVEITSYTHHPFYTTFCMESRYNWDFGHYYNVPIEDLMSIIDNAIHTGYSLCWDGDVTEQGFRFDLGLAYLPSSQEGKVTQELRQKTFDDRSTQTDHIMHLIAIAMDELGKKYYLVKNSWGNENPYHGCMYLSLSYLKLKTVDIMVHKKAIPDAIAKKMGLSY